MKFKYSVLRVGTYKWSPTPHACRGISLVELLVVISVVLVLAAFALANMSAMQGTLARTSCLGKLRDLGSAIAIYSSDNDNRFPGFGGNASSRWVHQIAPYLGHPSDAQYQGIPVTLDAYNFDEFACPARKLWKNPRVTVPGGIYGMNRSLIGNPFAGTPSSGPMVGISRVMVARPASTILLGDKVDSSPTLRISASSPWYPADPSGAAANHRPDLRPANGPQGPQNYLFVDGHAETRDGFPGLEAFAP